MQNVWISMGADMFWEVSRKKRRLWRKGNENRQPDFASQSNLAKAWLSTLLTYSRKMPKLYQ